MSRIALHIGNDCNLRCTYCYGGGGNYGEVRGSMSKEIIDQSLAFFLRAAPNRKNYHILFFGGEPLMYPLLMEYTKKQATLLSKEKDIKFTFSATTNGTILNKKVYSLLQNNKMLPMLSIDGMPKEHNKYRKTINGRGSFHLISRNIEKFRNIRDSIFVRVTLARDNINLVSIFDYLKGMKVRTINFLTATEKEEGSYGLSEQDFSNLVQEYERLAKKYVQYILEEKADSLIRINDFVRILRQLHGHKLKSYHCGFGQSYLSISSQGDIYPCHRFVGLKKYCMGNVTNPFDIQKLKNYQELLNVDSQEKCNNCIAKPFCAGGCYYESALYNEDILKPYELRCQIEQHIVKLSVLMYQRLVQSCPEKLKTLLKK